MKRWARIEGEHRLALGRRWSDAFVMGWVMLNPSTADANEDDPTIRRCIQFSKDAGAGSLIVLNLYTFRATDPNQLKARGYPNHPRADFYLRHYLGFIGRVVCAWGTKGKRERVDEVLAVMREVGAPPHALRVTKGGHPEHPLYLPGVLTPVPIDQAPRR